MTRQKLSSLSVEDLVALFVANRLSDLSDKGRPVEPGN